MVFVASPQVSWIFQPSPPPTLCFPFFYLSPPPPPIWLSLLPGSIFSFNLIVKNWIQSYKIFQFQLLWKRKKFWKNKRHLNLYQLSLKGPSPARDRCSLKVKWIIWMHGTIHLFKNLFWRLSTGTILSEGDKERTKQMPQSHEICRLLERQIKTREQSNKLKLVNEKSFGGWGYRKPGALSMFQLLLYVAGPQRLLWDSDSWADT